MPGPNHTHLWDRLRYNIVALCTLYYSLQETVGQVSHFVYSLAFRNWLKAAKSLCSVEEAEEFCLDTLEEEITTLEKAITQEGQKIGFCHNDLQYGNIMIDEETRLVTIIVSFLLCHLCDLR